jgi:hypothetical protein
VDSRRMASLTTGWNGPPKGECFSRWHGRTWPCVKKVEKSLETGVLANCVRGTGGGGRGLLVFEAYICRPEGPAQVGWIEGVAEGEKPPDHRVVESGWEA